MHCFNHEHETKVAEIWNIALLLSVHDHFLLNLLDFSLITSVFRSREFATHSVAATMGSETRQLCFSVYVAAEEVLGFLTLAPS